MSDKTVNQANTGDIVTLMGTPWRVIGFSDGYSALLERVGCEEMPVNQRTHHSVVLGSPYSKDFILRDHAPEPVDHPIPPQTTELHEPTIRACIAALPANAEILDKELASKMQKWTDGWNAYREDCVEALQSLLPKDRAKEILEQAGSALWKEDDAEKWYLADDAMTMQLTRWLISEGILR